MIERKPERRITDPEELAHVLRKAQILRLGMCGPEGPYVVPMNYGMGEGCLFLHSSCSGRKARTLRADPRVCFELETDVALIEDDKPCGFSMKFKSIVGFGRVVALDSLAEKRQGLRAIMAHYTGREFPDEAFPEKVLARTCVMRLDIESMTGARHGWNG
ncbi:pyridoxamine 5'-phosphate oxidase family protein [Desulfocurvus sp.]|jgi:hypothetical protein|uniref:pyridoxamine 5'-phosphate oxidase family protein n=1 Tax=Desulfocurvus sp. TaxID=2871698 RepID=UPI0025C38EBA|nr:pyridoxamine 5'-phosphate oxidase family protein [Desulfocurvus sp.]MCK9239849.1 pyridoxamine 5'-phosphate oxidase family protein [Desulfocurvus sp.]